MGHLPAKCQSAVAVVLGNRGAAWLLSQHCKEKVLGCMKSCLKLYMGTQGHRAPFCGCSKEEVEGRKGCGGERIGVPMGSSPPECLASPSNVVAVGQ